MEQRSKNVRKNKKRQYKIYGIIAVVILGGMISAKTFLGNDAKKLPMDQATAHYVPKVEHVEKLQSLSEQEAGDVLPSAIIDNDDVSKYFTIQEIDDKILERIDGKSYRENPHIRPENLRYLKVLHYNYDHRIQVGELIVNEKIAEDCTNIFKELFSAEYEIASMYLIDRYWDGNGVDADTHSVEANNTAAFNYRVVPGSKTLSNHAKGFAVDVNPLQNPYVTYKSDGSFGKYYKDMEKYLDRNSGKEHLITHQDLCYQVFRKYGFTWGGDWNSSKDYQHFQKVL